MRIEPVTLALLPSLRALWREAFGDDGHFWDTFLDTAFAYDRTRCVIEEGEVVSALCWLDATVDGHRLAYLYAIATRREKRGRGLCQALMTDTHAHLTDRGYDGAILVPSEPSLFDFYARVGYLPCAPMQTLTLAAADEPIALRRLNAEEYGRLREQYLPRGSVIQDKNSLRFLEAIAALYASDNLLVAAELRDGTLFCPELLGDTSLAPRIVRALGYTEGRFRLAGGHTPFAAYRPLTDRAPTAPSYFALAFD